MELFRSSILLVEQVQIGVSTLAQRSQKVNQAPDAEDVSLGADQRGSCQLR